MRILKLSTGLIATRKVLCLLIMRTVKTSYARFKMIAIFVHNLFPAVSMLKIIYLIHILALQQLRTRDLQ